MLRALVAFIILLQSSFAFADFNDLFKRHFEVSFDLGLLQQLQIEFEGVEFHPSLSPLPYHSSHLIKKRSLTAEVSSRVCENWAVELTQASKKSHLVETQKLLTQIAAEMHQVYREFVESGIHDSDDFAERLQNTVRKKFIPAIDELAKNYAESAGKTESNLLEFLQEILKEKPSFVSDELLSRSRNLEIEICRQQLELDNLTQQTTTVTDALSDGIEAALTQCKNRLFDLTQSCQLKTPKVSELLEFVRNRSDVLGSLMTNQAKRELDSMYEETSTRQKELDDLKIQVSQLKGDLLCAQVEYQGLQECIASERLELESLKEEKKLLQASLFRREEVSPISPNSGESKLTALIRARTPQSGKASTHKEMVASRHLKPLLHLTPFDLNASKAFEPVDNSDLPILFRTTPRAASENCEEQKECHNENKVNPRTNYFKRHNSRFSRFFRGKGNSESSENAHLINVPPGSTSAESSSEEESQEES